MAQLFGSDPEVLADAARVVEDAGFDGIDMNFGCPVKKVVKCNGGSGLLRDLPLAERILKAVRAAVAIPFTCKIRTGWDEDRLVYAQMGRLAEDCGLQGIALHGRTRAQGYAGEADWDRIAALKQAVGIPVVGNGDVFSPQDCLRMFRHTGCDGVMIGRAASSNPWIFRQIRQYIATGRYDRPTEADRYRLLSDYYRRLARDGDKISGDPLGKMKQFAAYFTRGVRNGARLRKAIYRVGRKRKPAPRSANFSKDSSEPRRRPFRGDAYSAAPSSRSFAAAVAPTACASSMRPSAEARIAQPLVETPAASSMSRPSATRP